MLYDLIDSLSLVIFDRILADPTLARATATCWANAIALPSLANLWPYTGRCLILL